jgi:methionine sulfoxide reductase heme-binding subunit
VNETLWYLSRATGVASILLLTVVVVLGVLVSGRRRPHGERATVVMAVHRWLSLGMVAFLLTHVATAVVETYVSIDVVSAVVPFTSGYETVWVGLGTVAVDLMVAVLLTSWWRHRLPERAWRVVHYAAYALWPAALVHGVVLGTSDEPLLLGTTLACGLVGVGAVLWRLLAPPHHDRARRDVVLEQEWT